MDAVKFVEERNRMCKSFVDRCTGCPAFNACEDELCCAVGPESTTDATAQITIVEEWSAAHPRKTRQSVFLEQWPEALVADGGTLSACPLFFSSEYRNAGGGCASPYGSCAGCRREFWMQEVE